MHTFKQEEHAYEDKIWVQLSKGKYLCKSCKTFYLDVQLTIKLIS